MAIDVSAAGAATGCIDVFNAYQYWISGVTCTNNKRAAFNVFQSTKGLVQSNYVYNSTGALPSNYGIRMSAQHITTRLPNNIIQQIQGGSIIDDGASTGNVYAYNFIIHATNSTNIGNPLVEHAGNYFNLEEGNVISQASCDDVHGTCDGDTRFRNFFTGWESSPSSPITSYTNSVEDWAYSRYNANIANVMGTPGYHTSYSTTAGNLYIYNMGTGNSGVSPAVPSDSLTKSTSLFWANYDSVTAANRFSCNSIDTGWASPCSSTTEAPASASTYPNFVPVVGDTAIGEPSLPNSFIYTSRPAWWSSVLPFPAIGPDVSSGGFMGQCSGTLNAVAYYNGTAALTNAQCLNNGLTASAWGGHVNVIPAMKCYLGIMGESAGWQRKRSYIHS